MTTQLTIDAGRLRRNFGTIQRVAGCDALAVIKADAYGHGAALCAPVLAAAGARWLGVSDPSEGAVVRAALCTTGCRDDAVDVLVMVGVNPGDGPACDLVAEHRLTPVIWTPWQLSALERAARASGRHITAHVEIDTGMNRQGVRPGDDLDVLLAGFSRSSRVSLGGVMSHLACAEVRNAAATRTARERLGASLGQVAVSGLQPEWLHLENTSAVDESGSAAALRAMAAQLGARPMVRSGLGLYGCALPLEQAGDPVQGAKLAKELEAVMTWTAPVSAVFAVAVGEHVGYGATFTASQPMRLALLPAGYADGFRRSASSGVGDGWVVLRGERAPVVGRVSMNLMVVDISRIPGVQVGDPATLLGAGITAADHAAWAGTIPYEIFCGVRGERRTVPFA